jgi:hypothetical protein
MGQRLPVDCEVMAQQLVAYRAVLSVSAGDQANHLHDQPYKRPKELFQHLLHITLCTLGLWRQLMMAKSSVNNERIQSNIKIVKSQFD